jgi:alpha-ketoglutarate-dependent taurine dioxygenase
MYAKRLDVPSRELTADTPEAFFGEIAGVEIGRLTPEQRVPVQIVPRSREFNLLDWCGAHQGLIEDLLLAHRAVLFRRCGLENIEQFERVAEAMSQGPRLEYTDRSTPRKLLGDRVYTSTEYPPEESIALHNEGTYWLRWPLKIFFACMIAPASGGETPIADTRAILSRISAPTRDRFIDKGVLYVRNYNHGFGLPWQEAFQTEDPKAVEAYCDEHRIEWEWKPNERLRTRQVRQAVARHPRTGEPLWFNHGAFFHVSSLEPWIRDELVRGFREEDLPFNTYYGDGAPIEPGVVEELRTAYRLELRQFAWERGDLLLLDNMSMCHGRQPYRGPRKIAVMMTEPHAPPDAPLGTAPTD